MIARHEDWFEPRTDLRTRLRLWVARQTPKRLHAAIHVLRGHPIAYRLRIDGGTMVLASQTRVDHCDFRDIQQHAIRIPEGVRDCTITCVSVAGVNGKAFRP